MPLVIALTILLTPAYAARFGLFGFPANLLMIWVFFVWIFALAYLAKNRLWADLWLHIKKDKKALILIAAFFLAGAHALFNQGISLGKAGQFLVLFLQPISLFFVSSYVFRKNPEKRQLLVSALYFLLAAAGLLAAFQYFSLNWLDPKFWGNAIEPKRATSFFSHPNFFALFSAPLLAFLIPDLITGLKTKAAASQVRLLAWAIGAFGLLLSMSRAGWLGLLAAILAYALLSPDKKIRLAIWSAIFAVLAFASLNSNLRYRLTLPFYGEKSAVSRISLWQTGIKAVKEQPLSGLGLAGFSKNWTALNTDPNLESHNFPHNVFLNLWVETGLLGLLSLAGLIAIVAGRGLRQAASLFGGSHKDLKNQANELANYKLAGALFLVALLTQGLLDNPYFKNDLAMVFWIIMSLAI